MKQTSLILLICVLLLACFRMPLLSQSATGSIAGTVTDNSGAVIPQAKITIVNKTTNAVRELITNPEGIYSAPGLEAGAYEVRSEQAGFKTLSRAVDVLAGTPATVNLELSVGETTEVVNVEATTAQVNYENHSVAGSIEHQSIENLPMNGRNFLQLASLEPGIQVVQQAQGTRNAPIGVTILGGGGSISGTLLTMDGMQINDFHDTGTALNFSQEVVQEFQLTSANFDLSTGITISGSVNLVTRSGGNNWHGSIYEFYRDHNLAAYPSLKRLALDENPFFQRKNPGVVIGGPLIHDKLFVFASYERTDQVAAVVIQPDLTSIAPAAAVFSSPNRYDYTTVRFDYRLSSDTSTFVRWTNDHNTGLGPNSNLAFPSNWLSNYNWSDQIVGVMTRTFGAAKVNELRFAYRDWENNETYPTPSQCGSPCLGGAVPGLAPFSLPQLSMVGSSNFATGGNGNIPQNRISRNYETLEVLSWQKGAHRLKFSGDLDFYRELFNFPLCLVGCMGVYSVETTQNNLGALTATYLPNLPKTITTTNDILNLPAYFLTATQYAGFEAGPGTTPGPWHQASERRDIRPRVFFQDTWKARPNLTFNYGLSYQYESGLYPSDMIIPGLEGPIYGLPPGTIQRNAQPNKADFGPALGFAWSPGNSGKTVVRGGMGLYWDTSNFTEKLHNQASVGPLGNGVVRFPSTFFLNTFPGIVQQGPGGTFVPLPIGAPLPTTTFTTLTLGQFMQIYNAQYPELAPLVNLAHPLTSGAYTYSNMDFIKNGEELYNPSQQLPRSYQTSVGIQRELPGQMVLSADWARRQTVNASLGELDLNHFTAYVNGVQSPIVPKCTNAQLFVLGAQCSTGSFTTYETEGRAVYEGLLIKLSKRYAHGYQFTASYAYQNLNAQSVFNLYNWSEGYGPTLARQNLNVSGIYNLPWGFELSGNSSVITRAPYKPVVSVDLTGSGGSTTEPLFAALNPGSAESGFWSQSQLAAAVAKFNSEYAGTTAPNGAKVPTYVVPPNYTLNLPTISQDFRLSKTFSIKERYRISLYGEVFNAFNIANLTSYSFNLDKAVSGNAAQTYAFGQPTARALGTFLSAGPRAEQFGARISF